MYLNPANDEVKKRQTIEVAIVKRVVKDALAAGYSLSVDDGGDEYAIKDSTDEKAVLDALINTDEDRLILKRADHRGVVLFVYGNDGWDVINDYSVRLEDVLAGANQLAEKYEEKAR